MKIGFLIRCLMAVRMAFLTTLLSSIEIVSFELTLCSIWNQSLRFDFSQYEIVEFADHYRRKFFSKMSRKIEKSFSKFFMTNCDFKLALFVISRESLATVETVLTLFQDKFSSLACLANDTDKKLSQDAARKIVFEKCFNFHGIFLS